MQEARAKLVLLGLGVLFDEPVRLQRLEQSVHGRAGDRETIRQLAHAKAPRSAGKRAKDPRSAINGLDRSLRSARFRLLLWG